MNSSPAHLFCFGMGYTAHHLAHYLFQQGWQISGTHRAAVPSSFYQSFLLQPQQPIPAAVLETVTHLLISIPPEGDNVVQLHAQYFHTMPHLKWIGYLSSTGVYGDWQGKWVDETSPLLAQEERHQRRIMAEQQWLGLWQQEQLPVHIFRLAGIYGPGRSALEQVAQGKAQRIDKAEQVFSRIHVDDIAALLHHSVMLPTPGEIINLADDYPCAQQEVIAFACHLLQVPVPPLIPFDQAHLSEMARSFYLSNRRVANNKMKKLFGYALRYPTYKEGLQALLKQ